MRLIIVMTVLLVSCQHTPLIQESIADSNPLFNFEMAKQFFKNKQYDATIQRLSSCASEYKENREWMKMLVESYLSSNKSEIAIEILLKYSLLNKDSEFLQFLGEAYYVNNEIDLAIEYYKKALDLNPINDNAHYALALILKSRDPKRSKQHAMDYLRLNIKNSDKTELNIKMYRELGENIFHFQPQRISQKDRLLLEEAATYFYENFQYDSAIEFLERIIGCQTCKASYLQYYLLALIYKNRCEFELSRTYFIKATALAPRRDELWFDFALLYFKQGDLKKAVLCFDKVLALKPKHIQAKEYRGYLQYKLNLPQKAMETFYSLLLMVPNNLTALYYIALIHEKTDQRKALLFWEKIQLAAKDQEEHRLVELSKEKIIGLKAALK